VQTIQLSGKSISILRIYLTTSNQFAEPGIGWCINARIRICREPRRWTQSLRERTPRRPVRSYCPIRQAKISLPSSIKRYGDR